MIERIQPDIVHAMRIPFEGMIASTAMQAINKRNSYFCRPPLLISVWGNDFTLHANATPSMARYTRLALQAGNPDLALALAIEAVDIPKPPGQVQMALSEAAYAPGTIRVFLGHQAPVWSVAVSLDGRYSLSGDENGVIFLWDLESGAALRRLEGHTGKVTSLVFTPDGRQALSASQDKTILHWDLETGQVISSLTGHKVGINTLALSPDGRLLASGSGRFSLDEPVSVEDNSVRLWDLESGEEIQRFTFFTDSITDVIFTPDGEDLAGRAHQGNLLQVLLAE